MIVATIGIMSTESENKASSVTIGLFNLSVVGSTGVEDGDMSTMSSLLVATSYKQRIDMYMSIRLFAPVTERQNSIYDGKIRLPRKVRFSKLSIYFSHIV
jgi:hypothetical protein